MIKKYGKEAKMEAEYEVVSKEVVLLCDECKIQMILIRRNYTYTYEYECLTCKKKTRSDKEYPYLKHVRKT